MSGIGCAEPPEVPEGAVFPGMGRRYRASFPAFAFELVFSPPSSLTWTWIEDDGRRGREETVEVRTEPVSDGIFLVSWQEANGTTVVHVEDFARHKVFTHITRTDGTFLRATGALTELPRPAKQVGTG